MTEKWLEILANNHCTKREDEASTLLKPLLAMKVKFYSYLEERLTVNDRICEPQDSHFRYPDSITNHFIDGSLFTRSL